MPKNKFQKDALDDLPQQFKRSGDDKGKGSGDKGDDKGKGGGSDKAGGEDDDNDDGNEEGIYRLWNSMRIYIFSYIFLNILLLIFSYTLLYIFSYIFFVYF